MFQGYGRILNDHDTRKLDCFSGVECFVGLLTAI